MNRTHLPHEFARRAGVTVRALHHYDRLGLLKPSGRTRAGYRVYSDRDFARLEQIVALKFIGFPLLQIRELLRRKDTDLLAALRQQRQILAEKRNHLDRAVQAIERAEQVVSQGGEPDWEPFRKVIEVIQMQTRKDWMKKYYTRGTAGESPPALVARGASAVRARLGRVGARHGGGDCERRRPDQRHRTEVGRAPAGITSALYRRGSRY